MWKHPAFLLANLLTSTTWYRLLTFTINKLQERKCEKKIMIKKYHGINWVYSWAPPQP